MKRPEDIGRIAFIWEYCGPYHLARIRTLRASYADLWLVEMADKNITYAWTHSGRRDLRHIVLFPGYIAERIPAWHVFIRMRRWLRETGISVLFVPSYWPASSFAAALAAKSLGVKVVFMGDSHYASGSNTGFAITAKRLLMRFYDAALVAGSLHRSFLRHLGMPADRIFDGYDTVDNDHFIRVSDCARSDAVAVRRRLKLPKRYILSLGRLVPKKNLPTVIRAYSLMADQERLNGHDLVFVGSGPMQKELTQLARSFGLGVVDHNLADGTFSPPRNKGVVHFFPFSQIDEVPAFYALATAFVLASTSDEWGLVVNEAMASGCPVVVSRSVGSSLDLVVPNVTGLSFVSENRQELAWCLEKICSNLERASEMGVAARKHIAEWSNQRFSANALKAARAALGEMNDRGVDGSVSLPSRTVWFLQTCFPDYRMPVFSRLHRRLGLEFHLFSGASYFTPDIKTTTDFLDWHSFVENRFLLRRRFLWQTGACEAMFHAQVVVMELNPRILSTWVILAARRLWGAPTLLWGHAWGREDSDSIRNVLRLYMMRLASGTIAYTRSQRDEVRSVFPSLRVFAATNSLIRAEDCSPLLVRSEDLDTVIYVGRLNAPKKPRLLVEGFARARLPGRVRLCIVGDGAERAALQEMAGTMGLGDRLKLLGHLHNQEVLRSLYARSFCSVSAGYVGLGAIQSFSFGVPLVLADKEPHAPEVEACHEGENTVYFKADDPAALANVLEKMWAERADWLKKRESLSCWTAKNYSVESMVEGFVEAVDAVCPVQATTV